MLNTATITSGEYLLNGGNIAGGTWNASAGTLRFATFGNNRISNNATISGDLNLDIFGGTARFQSGANFTGDATLSATSTRLSIEDTVTLSNKTINLDGSVQASRWMAVTRSR